MISHRKVSAGRVRHHWPLRAINAERVRGANEHNCDVSKKILWWPTDILYFVVLRQDCWCRSKKRCYSLEDHKPKMCAVYHFPDPLEQRPNATKAYTVNPPLFLSIMCDAVAVEEEARRRWKPLRRRPIRTPETIAYKNIWSSNGRNVPVSSIHSNPPSIKSLNKRLLIVKSLFSSV